MKNIVVCLLSVSCMLIVGCEQSDGENVAVALLPLTGNVSSVGQYLQNGLMLGGESFSNGLDIVVEDSKADAKEGYTAFRRALLKRSPKMVFTAISGVALAIRDEAERNAVLHFSMVGSEELLTSESRFTYRFFPSTDYIASEIQKWLSARKIKRIGILYLNSEWGNSYLMSLQKRCREAAITFGYISAVDVERSQYQNIAEKVRESDVECLCVSMQGDAYAELVKRVRMSGYVGTIVCDNNFTSAVAARCRDSLQDVKVVDFCRPRGGVYSLFVEKYESRYGGKPDMPAVLAYEVMQMLDVAAKTMGGYEAWKDNAKMQSFSYDGMLGRIFIKGREIRFPLEMKNACELFD